MFRKVFNKHTMSISNVFVNKYCTGIEKDVVSQCAKNINFVKKQLSNISNKTPSEDNTHDVSNTKIYIMSDTHKFNFKFNNKFDLMLLMMSEKIKGSSLIHIITYPNTNIVNEPYEENLKKIIESVDKKEYCVEGEKHVIYGATHIDL